MNVAEMRDQRHERYVCQGAYRSDAEPLKVRGGLRPDAQELVHRKRADSSGNVALGEDDEAIGFAEIGCKFGQQFVRADTDRAGKAGGGLDTLLNCPADVERRFREV